MGGWEVAGGQVNVNVDVKHLRLGLGFICAL